MDYDFFYRDGAYFRRLKVAGQEMRGHSVDDVFFESGGWTPYEGDGLKPVYFGDQIKKRELPAAARRALLV
jgi:hypothetical protein